jgi:hypothetical protein
LNFNQKQKKHSSNFIKKRLSDDSNTNKTNNSEITYTLEDYLTQPQTKSINFEFREVNIINDSIYDNDTDYNINNNGIDHSNYSNLTECSIKSIESDELKMEGGLVNTTIYSLINDEGFLQSVYEISTSLMKPPDEDEEDEDTDILYSQIYNNDNQISLKQAKESDNNGTQKNNISFGITSFYTNSSNIINCTNHFINEEINKKLYDYFDSFEYELYNNIINNISISSEEENNENRYLSEKENNGNSYYGMKKITYMKQLYKYNLIGMKMEGQMFSEINPSNGRFDVYSILNFGNKNSKIKVKEQISNTHIVLERSNQMGYNLLLLLNKSNNELIKRNENYSQIILEFEINFTNFFKVIMIILIYSGNH